ncbi:hypothetical protein ALQ76_05470 [Pseudomonas syringae pv. atrofaciens]|nr:hypothetical protein ALQ76_05470 [Pseudomonas syringae pv. atrofaciens]
MAARACRRGRRKKPRCAACAAHRGWTCRRPDLGSAGWRCAVGRCCRCGGWRSRCRRCRLGCSSRCWRGRFGGGWLRGRLDRRFGDRLGCCFHRCLGRCFGRCLDGRFHRRFRRRFGGRRFCCCWFGSAAGGGLGSRRLGGSRLGHSRFGGSCPGCYRLGCCSRAGGRFGSGFYRGLGSSGFDSWLGNCGRLGCGFGDWLGGGRFNRRFGCGFCGSFGSGCLGNRCLGGGFRRDRLGVASGQDLADRLFHAANTLGQFQAFLCITLEVQDVSAGFSLTILESVQQLFQLGHGTFGLGLRLGFSGSGSVLQLDTGVVQFFLRLAALFLKLGEQFLGISQGLGTGVFQMFKQAAR